jgi:hypothetical protein
MDVGNVTVAVVLRMALSSGVRYRQKQGLGSTVDQRSVFEPRQNLPLAAAGMLRRWTNEEPANVSGKWRGVQ